MLLSALAWLSLVAANTPVKDVFLVPHAHCDVGWLKTVEGYFDDQVSHILDTVTTSLFQDRNKTFIWSEIKWLQMWWPHQTEATREKFRAIVHRGQLEFVGAGWSQNDEVTPAWADIVDNQVTGHEYLRRIGLQDVCPQPGRCVRYGWQIDMFAGFSGATPSLWALSGYDGMFSRWEGTASMRRDFSQERAFEYLWDASKHLPKERGRIWSHIINGNYGDLASLRCGQNDTGHSWVKPFVPCTAANKDLSFNWDKPGVSAVTDDNVAAYAELFAAFAKKRGSVYRGPFLAVWGSDYAFTNATRMYENMDKIVAELNAHPETYGMQVRYTTLSRYADHVHGLNLSFPVKTWPLDFEYGWPHQWNMSLTGNFTTQYQTGAPTSRSQLKQRVRASSALHRGVEATHGLVLGANLSAGALSAYEPRTSHTMGTWDTLGILQHHDALTGTMSTKGSFPWGGAVDEECWDRVTQLCKPCDDEECMVLEDYLARLDAVDRNLSSVLSRGIETLAGVPVGALHPPSADTGGAEGFLTVVFNPVAVARTSLVAVPLPKAFTAVTVTPVAGASGDYTSTPVPAQVSADGSSVHFLVALPALGWSSYRVSPVAAGAPGAAAPTSRVQVGGSQALGYGPASAQLTLGSDGQVARVTVKNSGVTMSLDQDYMVYETDQGGPYCLVEQGEARPPSDSHHQKEKVSGLAAAPSRVDVSVWKGPLFSEVVVNRTWGDDHFAAAPRLATTHRITNGTSLSDVVLVMHEVPVLPLNREVVSRIHTDLQSMGTIFHDDSGFELYPKKDDPSLPISGRYHALVQSSVIRDGGGGGSRRQLAVLSTHTKGVASLSEGAIEYMLARRINGTDDQGPWPLNETVPLKITMGLLAEQEDVRRVDAAFLLENPPVVLTAAPGDGLTPKRPTGSPATELPAGVHATHFFVRMGTDDHLNGKLNEKFPGLASGLGSELVLRLRNVRDVRSVPVDVTALLPSTRFRTCTETTLTLQQDREQSQRLVWRADDGSVFGKGDAGPTGGGCHAVVIDPFDVRTFVLRM